MSEDLNTDARFRLETDHALSILTTSVTKLTEDISVMSRSVTELVQSGLETNRLSKVALTRVDEQKVRSKKHAKKIETLEERLRPLEDNNEKFKKLEAFLWQKIGLGLTVFAAAVFGIVYVTR